MQRTLGVCYYPEHWPELTGGLRVRDSETPRFVFNYGPDAQQFEGKTIEVADVVCENLANGQA